MRQDCRAHAPTSGRGGAPSPHEFGRRSKDRGECTMTPHTASPPTGITRVTLLKDLRLEWRSKDAINSMLFFSLLVVMVFSFSFDPNAEESRQIAGGLVWVAFLF